MNDDHSDDPQPPPPPGVEPGAAAPGPVAPPGPGPAAPGDGSAQAAAAGAAGAGIGAGCIIALVVAIPVVLGIVGILAAIAIPNFIAMQLRAKRAELPANLDGIRTAEKAYHAEWDTFTNAGPSPAATPGRAQVTFSPVAAWANLGWSADGKVRGKYQVTLVAGTSSQTDNFNGSAVADIDGDGTLSSYTCNRGIKSKMRSANNVY